MSKRRTGHYSETGARPRARAGRPLASGMSDFEKRRYEEQARLQLCPECGCGSGRHLRGCVRG